MLGINDLAPEFTLKNTSKEDVSLSDFTDKTVVLAFYPGAFTGVCDAEMCALQDNLKSFNDLNAIVLGISVDSPWANGGFSKQYSLEFDLLSDLDKKVINDYNVVFNGLGGIENYTCANRAVFIIKEGVIKYRWDAAPNPGVEPDYNEIKKQLENI
ncbi:MAG: redoxin domain-containing protein [Candidatus Neomarinimicrobiota bacterium]|jgi:peroxiredoxin|nr:redoxin domain-containing protein [Candidatus Neomarinimicrobiota bacterium]MEC9026842.1 redoxin domain-containing protein [Candidatus Neomarinimicrobiota bacterium]MED5256769.1 redoxin domain-containing protein [Candidatus Neomarinimicrobiota bacterium]MED5266794.1 redoxin domain-containing protein [Candidatus Neomarinimicrobiota bacterium]|tara:strand:+ start:3136 stop:3603 length:468 start_codon:yes stop_codon:yes gene_type:complete